MVNCFSADVRSTWASRGDPRQAAVYAQTLLVAQLVLEEFPGGPFKRRHAQRAIGSVVFLRVAELDSREQHLHPFLVEACRLGEQVLTRQLVATTLQSAGNSLGRDVPRQRDEIVRAVVWHPL